MSLIIRDEVLAAARISADDLLLEIAILLFQPDRLTLGQVSTLLGVDRLTFQKRLATRKIPVHYDQDEFEADLATLQKLGQL